MSKTFLLVAEGASDIVLLEELALHFSTQDCKIKFDVVAPQRDATSGTFDPFGYGQVLNWCQANKNKAEMLVDFKGAEALIVQMDTDISSEINPTATVSARQICESALNNMFGTLAEPNFCEYILCSEKLETWILASHDEISALDNNLAKIIDFELLSDTDLRLKDLGYPCKRKKNGKVQIKKNNPNKRYKRYAIQLIQGLNVAKQRCSELGRLCNILTQ